MSLAGLSLDEIETMKVIDLKKHLKELSLSLNGNKTELQKRLTDALMASKQATTDNNNNSKKPPLSSAAVSTNKPSESNNNPSSSSGSNAQGKNTNEPTSTKEEEKKNAELENSHKHLEVDEDGHKVLDNNGQQQNDNINNKSESAPQKKLSNIKRIEVEGLPEELLVWETEESSTTGKKDNGISRNLGVTTAELVLQRQERIKKYGMQSMPEQVKRMLRKERFNNTNDPNKPQSNAEKKDDNTSNDTNTRSDFSIQSVLASDGASEGLTREKLSQRKKRFGDVAVQNAFQESMQSNFGNKNKNNRSDRNNRNNNNNNNRNNNYASTRNQSGNIRQNRDRNMLDEKIQARMERFGTKPSTENNNRRDFGRDWNSIDRKARRPQDRYYKSRRNNNDRSRSRQRNRENETVSLDEELGNIVESTIHTATKSGGVMKDFGSDDEFGVSAEDLERMEQRKKKI